MEHADTCRHLLGDNLGRRSCEERQAGAQCLMSQVVVPGEHGEIDYALPFGFAPQKRHRPTAVSEGPLGHVYRLRLAHFYLPAAAVERGEVSDAVDCRIQQRGAEGPLAGPGAGGAEAIPDLAELSGRWQGRQGLPSAP
jgi:hypothetical protein